ncbi:hypothetical protein CFC21_072389 [Triticum aestivum]|uniref:RING-type domain-containing protein n=2 Tax=Triticum aestivum TaxID=4565 RepID=A0A9R1HJ20_WHEAT|nr:hypothetical protein CFC21_072389 [Triticum aestivum]
MEGAPRVVPSRRGGVTLAEQLAASSNLRDLLKLRDDDVQGEGDGARPARRRTLLDVIRGPEDDAAPPAPPSSTRAAEPAPTAAVAGAVPGAASPGQGEERRVSLMALLEQAERQWTTAAARAGAWTRVDQDAAAEGEEGSGRGVGGRCCVCMARRKGAAFVPCGHTFCRACAREVRAGRGRCPLCNAAIREVLNLF